MPFDITQSPVWHKAEKVIPTFYNNYNNYVHEFDKFGGPLMARDLRINAEDFLVAFLNEAGADDGIPVGSPNTPDADVPFPYLCLIPFIAVDAVCDENGAMPISAGISMMDMVTSFHIMMAVYEQGHVSLSMQSNYMAPMLRGKQYYIVTKVDKMGRRMVFVSIEFLELREDAEAEVPMGTVKEVMHALKTQFRVLQNVKHVKSILSLEATKKGIAHREKEREAKRRQEEAEAEEKKE